VHVNDFEKMMMKYFAAATGVLFDGEANCCTRTSLATPNQIWRNCVFWRCFVTILPNHAIQNSDSWARVSK
jgi:hypothetical protein